MHQPDVGADVVFVDGGRQRPSGRAEHADAQSGEGPSGDELPKVGGEGERPRSDNGADQSAHEQRAAAAAVGVAGQGQHGQHVAGERGCGHESETPGGKPVTVLEIRDQSEDGRVARRERERRDQ